MGGRILFYRKNMIFRFPKTKIEKKKITLSVTNSKRWALQLVQIQQILTRSFRHRMKLINGAVSDVGIHQHFDVREYQCRVLTTIDFFH